MHHLKALQEAKTILSRLDPSSVAYHLATEMLSIAPGRAAKQFVAATIIQAVEQGDAKLEALRDQWYQDTFKHGK